MKFCHIADLHIGKKLKELSLLDDQRHALAQILNHVDAFSPDAVFIAGDIYDKAFPSSEAVNLLSDFLTALCAKNRKVLLVGGNHDSQERLAFLGPLLKDSGLYITAPYHGEIEKATLLDEWGEVDIYMLPYFAPREHGFETFEEAVRAAVQEAHIDHSRRSILITHFFVTALGEEAIRSQSEVDPIGSLSNVDFSCFDGFNYVALGHLHGPQRVGRDTVRYAGSPMRYSFSEIRQRKSMVAGEIGKDGKVVYSLLPLESLHGMQALTGEMADLVQREKTDAYTHITLTDVPPPRAAYEQLNRVYENLLTLDFTGFTPEEAPLIRAEETDPMGLFGDFFLHLTGKQMSDGAAQSVNEIIRRLWKGDAE